MINQIEDGGHILNDCGKKDVWPVLAKSMSWGYGSTGTYGMKSGTVHDRFHPINHSQYFNDKFVKKYWKPFIKERKIVKTESFLEDDHSPAWFWLFEFPFKWILLIFAILLSLQASPIIQISKDIFDSFLDLPPLRVKNAASNLEAALTPLQLKQVQRLLCVNENADYGEPGSLTRNAIKAFEEGVNAANVFKAGSVLVDGIINSANERRNLLDAVRKFNIESYTSCRYAGLLSAFEAGYFSIDGKDEAIMFIKGDVVLLALAQGKLTKEEADKLQALRIRGLDSNFRKLMMFLREKYALNSKDGQFDAEFLKKLFK